MNIAVLIIFFVFGIIIGSFLNVVIFRLNTGKTFGGRSQCLSCHKTLSWYELVPVASFLLQRGRCRSCRARISFQYPLIELASGLIFLGLFLKLQASFFYSDVLSFAAVYAFYAVMFSILLVITAYDARHKVIPDSLVIVFGILAFAGLFLFRDGFLSPHIPSFYDFLYGILFALPFGAIWFFSKGKWMGLGDGKLALGLSWFLGPVYMFSALALAFWTGAAVGMILVAFKKLSGLKSEVPFAPFLALGAILAFFFQLNFFGAAF